VTVKSNKRLCKEDPRATAIIPGDDCAGDGRYTNTPCDTPARWVLGGIRRCTFHTASVLHDLPAVGAS
jgi:hypothetical protein